MSHTPCDDPDHSEKCPEAVELVVLPRTGDIGGFTVQRALPAPKRRLVGPFIFWDQMGPGTFEPGRGLDVRPHPHIGLSTVTYLFEGTMGHKDSLGNDLVIAPGEVNLMTAGKGIVHSERSDPDSRAANATLYGIQSWMALPKDQEEIDPSFTHFDASDIPSTEGDGAKIDLVMGSSFGLKSPVIPPWETTYANITLAAGSRLELPTDVEERALYILQGALTIDEASFGTSQLVVLKPGSDVVITATKDAHFLLLGGAALDGPRLIWWNYVSSRKERIIEAAEDWKAGKFPTVPGDDEEFIPLPDMGPLLAMKDI